MSALKRLIKFLRLPGVERCLVLEALLRLGLARLAVRTRPFSQVVAGLGVRGQETPVEALPPAQQVVARQVGWALRRVARLTPWDSNCLAQAIAARHMLHRRGLPVTVYLGAALDETHNLLAHAWVRSGQYFVTGSDGARRYGVVACFAA